MESPRCLRAPPAGFFLFSLGLRPFDVVGVLVALGCAATRPHAGNRRDSILIRRGGPHGGARSPRGHGICRPADFIQGAIGGISVGRQRNRDFSSAISTIFFSPPRFAYRGSSLYARRRKEKRKKSSSAEQNGRIRHLQLAIPERRLGAGSPNGWRATRTPDEAGRARHGSPAGEEAPPPPTRIPRIHSPGSRPNPHRFRGSSFGFRGFICRSRSLPRFSAHCPRDAWPLPPIVALSPRSGSAPHRIGGFILPIRAQLARSGPTRPIRGHLNFGCSRAICTRPQAFPTPDQSPADRGARHSISTGPKCQTEGEHGSPAARPFCRPWSARHFHGPGATYVRPGSEPDGSCGCASTAGGSPRAYLVGARWFHGEKATGDHGSTGLVPSVAGFVAILVCRCTDTQRSWIRESDFRGGCVAYPRRSRLGWREPL